MHSIRIPTYDERDYYIANNLSSEVIGFYAPSDYQSKLLVSSDYQKRTHGGDDEFIPTDTVINSPLFWRTLTARRLQAYFYPEITQGFYSNPYEALRLNLGAGYSIEGQYCVLFPGDPLAFVSRRVQMLSVLLLDIPDADIQKFLLNSPQTFKQGDIQERQRIKNWMYERGLRWVLDENKEVAA